MADLKPCPFCGNTELYDVRRLSVSGDPRKQGKESVYRQAYVGCPKCNVRLHATEKELKGDAMLTAAANAWNHRAGESEGKS